MVIISPIFLIAAYLLRFFFTRHRRILWTGTTILAKALMDILLQVLQHDVFIYPLVRAAIFIAAYIVTLLFWCLLDGISLCDIHDRRILTYTSNLAYGGRGPARTWRKRRKRGKIFNATLGFPGEGWAQLRFGTWNTRGITFQRFKYCQKLGYDVLALTELWRGQHKYQTKSTTGL